MKKSHGKIDWTIAEDDEAWQAGQSAAQPESAPGTQRRQKLALATVTAAFLLLLMGGWFWPGSTPAKGAIQKLSPAAAQAAALISAQEEQPLTQTLESLGNPMHINNIQRIGDHVMAQVIVNYREEGNVRAYRETRFYAKKRDQWQRIPPDPALLGPQRTLKIANFTILYPAVDADAVYEAVPKLEQLYAALRHDFGLPAVADSVAYTIEVASSAQGANFYNYSQNKLTIPSPLLLSAPVEITPATLLEQATVYPLAHLLIHEAIEQHDSRWQYNFSRWYPIENALSLWELWHAGGPLASDRAALVNWLYKNGRSANSRQPLPDAYAQLCRTYHIWQLTPSALSLPLTCSQEDANIAPSNDYPALAPTWPQPTDYPGPTAPLLQSAKFKPITLESMIEYVVATYGRDKLPQLLDALGQQTSPNVLIPALFGISRADFEAGWQAYLARHY